MGRSHEAVGALGWTGMVAVGMLHPAAGQLAAGVVVAAGAGLMPDIDHPNGTIAHCFPPVSGWLCRRVYALCGHRGKTHTAAAVGLVGVAVWLVVATTTTRTWTMVICGVAGLWLVRVLGPESIRYGIVGSAAAAVGIAYVVGWYVRPGPWVWQSATIGYASHLAGDTLSKQGVPWLWPLTGYRVRAVFPVLASDGLVPVESEREWVLASLALLAVAWLCYEMLGPAAAHVLAGG